MQTFKGHILSLLLLSVLLILNGCSQERLETVIDYPVPADTDNINLNIEIILNTASSQDTRAGGNYQLSGTAAETKITNITIFVVDLIGSNPPYVEDPGKVRYGASIYSPQSLTATSYRGEVNMKVSTGKKHIYVVTNLSSAQIENIKISGDWVYRNIQMSNGALINDFLDLSHNGRGIPMVGQMKVGGSEVIEITPTASHLTLDINSAVDVDRAVAKVLLTCTTLSSTPVGGTSGIKYVDITDLTANGNGWMRLDDVYFTLNTTNKQLPLPFAAQSPTNKMSDFITKVGGDYQIKNNTTYQQHFNRYDPPVITRGNANTWMTGNAYEWLNAEEEDAGRTGIASSNHYTTGLYCLENGILNDNNTIVSGDINTDAPLLCATHMVVYARYTPKKIIHGYDPALGGELVLDADEAYTKLFLEYPNDNPNSPADGTYWVRAGKYYNWYGMSKVLEPPPSGLGYSLSEFTEYRGGWGYYTTLIDGTNISNNLKYQDGQSDVLKNDYYILHGMSFSVPQANTP